MAGNEAGDWNALLMLDVVVAKLPSCFNGKSRKGGRKDSIERGIGVKQ